MTITKIHTDSDFVKLRKLIVNDFVDSINIQANAPSVQTSDTRDLWPLNSYYKFPETGTLLNIYSDNANDASGGTGATQLVVIGLDENLDNISEVVILNGVTPVQTASSFFRVNRFFVIGAGTSQQNEGTITIESNDTSDPLGIIQPGYSEGSQGIYTLGKDYREAWIQSIHFRAQKRQASLGEARLKVRGIHGGVPTPWQTKFLFTSHTAGASDGFNYTLPLVGPLPTSSEFKLEIDSVDTNDTGLFANVQIILIR
jgi:hypothetical protein